MARLAGEVEQIIAAIEQGPHPRGVADVGDLDPNALADRRDIERVAAVIGREIVDRHDLAAQPCQPERECRTDEAEPAGDDNPRLAECGGEVRD